MLADIQLHYVGAVDRELFELAVSGRCRAIDGIAASW